MRRIAEAEYRRVPWRNGGGTTREIVVEPPTLVDGERFRFRVSIADVERDGPFSRFDGYDRHIVVLAGSGMDLDCGAHGVLALRPLVPQCFSGDWPAHGRLVAGPVRDLNVIVDRGRATASLAAVELASPRRFQPLERGGLCLVHLHAGSLEGAERGDTLLLDAEHELAPRGRVTAIVAMISPRRP